MGLGHWAAPIQFSMSDSQRDDVIHCYLFPTNTLSTLSLWVRKVIRPKTQTSSFVPVDIITRVTEYVQSLGRVNEDPEDVYLVLKTYTVVSRPWTTPLHAI